MKKLPEKFFLYADRHISPFEGSPRAGAAEYVLRGDVNNQRVIKEFINTNKFFDRYKIKLFRQSLIF